MSIAARQCIKVNINHQLAPSVWVRAILHRVRGRSLEKVHRNLVAAKLQLRYPYRFVYDCPESSGDGRSASPPDFQVDSSSYHVVRTLEKEVIEQCTVDIAARRHPVLIVPEEQVLKGKHLVEFTGLKDRVTIFALEDFITQNVLGISVDEGENPYATLQRIISEYNKRVEAVETDMALKIELL